VLTPAATTIELECARCGGEIRVVPGEAYRAEDAPLFEQTAAAVDAVTLPEADLRCLVIELSSFSARAKTPEKLLSRLVEAIPSLRFLEPGQGFDRERLVHALGMLLAILAAHADQ